MKKKSPYKAAKSSPKATYSTKKLSPNKKTAGSKSPTKQEKAQARLLAKKRAQEWAKKELGKKKVPSPADSPSVIVIDDDDDDMKDDHKMCVENNTKVSTTATATTNKKKSDKPSTNKSKTLHRHLSGLDIDNNQKKKITNGIKDSPNKEDTFYDALGYLPKHKNDDITVEDVSDEEDDDEIRGLNSLQPSDGQWMQPLEHSPSKKHQEPVGKSYSTFTPVKPEPNGTSFSTYSLEPAEQETKGWSILNMFSTFSASKAEPKKQQEP